MFWICFKSCYFIYVAPHTHVFRGFVNVRSGRPGLTDRPNRARRRRYGSASPMATVTRDVEFRPSTRSDFHIYSASSLPFVRWDGDSLHKQEPQRALNLTPFSEGRERCRRHTLPRRGALHTKSKERRRGETNRFHQSLRSTVMATQSIDLTRFNHVQREGRTVFMPR